MFWLWKMWLSVSKNTIQNWAELFYRDNTMPTTWIDILYWNWITEARWLRLWDWDFWYIKFWWLYDKNTKLVITIDRENWSTQGHWIPILNATPWQTPWAVWVWARRNWPFNNYTTLQYTLNSSLQNTNTWTTPTGVVTIPTWNATAIDLTITTRLDASDFAKCSVVMQWSETVYWPSTSTVAKAPWEIGIFSTSQSQVNKWRISSISILPL